MHISQYEKILNVNENSEIIIGIGDSFCAGVGSESIEIWEENNWDVGKMRLDDRTYVEAYEGSFINLLTKKYFKNYTSINLGMAGRGNRYAINELFLYPYTNLTKPKEKIVIFVSSSLERYDFMNNIFTLDEHVTTIWPHGFQEGKIGYGDLKKPTGKSIFDETFVISEFILMFQHLITWCKLYNAKLLFVSAFSPELDLDYMLNNIEMKGTGDNIKNILNSVLTTIPWHNQIKPMGYKTIAEMLLSLEGRNDLLKKPYGLMEYVVDKHTEKSYMSKCQHPAKAGQELLCDIFYDRIVSYEENSNFDYSTYIKNYLNEKYPKPKIIRENLL